MECLYEKKYITVYIKPWVFNSLQIYMKKNIIVYIKPWVFNSNWYERTITMWRYVKSKCEKSGMLIWKKKVKMWTVSTNKTLSI